MDDDFYGRHVSLVTADSVDTYTIVDPNNSNFSFALHFPTGTDTVFVYGIINQYEPQNSGFQGSPIYSDYANSGLQPCGNSLDRPFFDDGFGVGFCFFDQTLGKPIWYTGSGTSGWVDSTGAAV